jgi:hypothetical protein
MPYKVCIISAAAAAVLLLSGSGAAEAARCAKGSIWRPSLGVCQSKARAAQAGVYRPRVARANISIKWRYKRPPVKRASNVQKAQIAPESSIQKVHGTAAIPRALESVPSLRCDELCQLQINLHTWAARNRTMFTGDEI